MDVIIIQYIEEIIVQEFTREPPEDVLVRKLRYRGIGFEDFMEMRTEFKRCDIDWVNKIIDRYRELEDAKMQRTQPKLFRHSP